MKKTMKLLMLMLLVAAGIETITSCSKQPQIYGKWKITEVSLTMGGEPVTEPGIAEFYEASVVGHTMEFRKDGTVIGDGNEEKVGYYTLKDNEVILKDAIRKIVNGVEELHDTTGTIQILTDTDLSVDFLYPAEYTGLDVDAHVVMRFVRE
jgi:hypothetical protein